MLKSTCFLNLHKRGTNVHVDHIHLYIISRLYITAKKILKQANSPNHTMSSNVIASVR